MRIQAIVLQHHDFGDQWKNEVEDRREYTDFLKSGPWRKRWTNFDCLCHEPVTDTVGTMIMIR